MSQNSNTPNVSVNTTKKGFSIFGTVKDAKAKIIEVGNKNLITIEEITSPEIKAHEAELKELRTQKQKAIEAINLAFNAKIAFQENVISEMRKKLQPAITASKVSAAAVDIQKAMSALIS